jgi:putative DNA primase/helicase
LIEPDSYGNGTVDWRDQLMYRVEKSGKKVIQTWPANAMLVLDNDPAWKDVLVWNEFTSSLSTTRVPPWDACDMPERAQPGVWTDADTTRAQAWLARHYELSVSKEALLDAAMAVSERHVCHPVREWVEALEWDAKKRCDTWLSKYLGVVASPYTSRVGRWFLISAIARVYRPGSKVDTMLVLEGDQGIRKSSALKALFDPWFSDTPLDLASKDRFLGMRGVWVHEFAELDSFGKADVARIKSFLSSAVDEYRPPYGRMTVKVPRQCVFAGTVNPTGEYFRDESGNRRLWPVKCGEASPIDLDGLERDRELIIAEARELFTCGERWWPEGPDEVRICAGEQEKRSSIDAWEPVVDAWLAKLKNDRDPRASDGVTVGDVLGGPLGIDKARWDQAAQNRGARALRAAKWKRIQKRFPDGRRQWVYLPPDASPVSSVELDPLVTDMLNGSAHVTSHQLSPV